jgi:hypothetical protein
MFTILKKTILIYQNVKKANEREKVGEQGKRESGNKYWRKNILRVWKTLKVKWK